MLTPACFETGFGFVSGFEKGYHGSQVIFAKKNPKLDKFIEGEDFFTLDCNNYTGSRNYHVPVAQLDDPVVQLLNLAVHV